MPCHLLFKGFMQAEVANYWLYSFLWVIPRRLGFMRRRFGTLCFIFVSRVNKTIK